MSEAEENARNHAVFSRELRLLYEEDVEDANRQIGQPLLAELHVLCSYCAYLSFERQRMRMLDAFYEKRRKSPVSNTLAGVRAMHSVVKETLAFGEIAPTMELSALPQVMQEKAKGQSYDGWRTRYLAAQLAKHWLIYKNMVLKELRLPVSEEAVEAANKLASMIELGLDAMSLILAELLKMAEEKK